MLDEGPILAALRGPRASGKAGGTGFIYSDGFRSVLYGDHPEFMFSNKQAQVVEYLWNAWFEGLPGRHQREIQGAAETSQRVGQLFADHQAYGTLIQYDGDGRYWLDL